MSTAISCVVVESHAERGLSRGFEIKLMTDDGPSIIRRALEQFTEFVKAAFLDYSLPRELVRETTIFDIKSTTIFFTVS